VGPVESTTPRTIVVTSSAAMSDRRDPSAAPAVRISAIALLMRSRVAGVAMRPEAHPARSVSMMPRFITENSAYRRIQARSAGSGASSASSVAALDTTSSSSAA